MNLFADMLQDKFLKTDFDLTNLMVKQGPDLNVPAVGQLEGRAFLGLNPFCRIKYYKGQLLEVVLPCMTQLFIPCHKYFLGHMVNTLAVK